MNRAIQTALRLIYPSRCLLCDERVESDFGLCGSCWGETPFISGVVCDLCGQPLPGDGPAEDAVCDDCLKIARPWDQGRACLTYRDNGRKLVLALKHGDRHDILQPAGRWMVQSASALLDDMTLIVPVPLHWTRLLRRRFNQSALLAQALANETGLPCCPDFLQRTKRTPSLDGKTVDDRFKTLDQVIAVHPKRADQSKGKSVLLIDDVMTSGATLAAATLACQNAGVTRIRVLALARVTKAP